MKPDSDAMRLLIERLLGYDEAWFTAEDLDAALSWLSGSTRHGGEALAGRIGPASEQPGRRIAVYDRLSAQLFRDGQLDLAGAHVDIDIDHEIRRGRYRRLMTAFHPDRFPQHADWLTSRSQAVLASYARFRKGEAPENRRPEAATGHRPKPAARAKRPVWPRERRSARLTPMSGPGPLTRLRTWLLGIENLQQRILAVLVVVCLLPVIYAYVAYKPYRAIDPADPSLVESPPPAQQPEQTPAVTDAPEPVAGQQHAIEADTGPVLAWSERKQPAPIYPDWHRTGQASRTRDDAASSGTDREPLDNAEATTREPAAAAQQAPDLPEQAGRNGDTSSDSSWPERLADAAGESLAVTLQFITAVETEAPPESEAGEPVDDSGQARDADSPPAQRRVAEALPQTDPAPDNAGTQRTADGALERQARAEPSGEQSPPGDESQLAGSGAGASPAEQPPTSERPARAVAAEARVSEPAPRTGPADESVAAAGDDAPGHEAVEGRSREHIKELLAGYRTSFEKGWLDDFLDHFTADPRENAHRGRGWFRNNYGWLFDNTAERRLDIDILDITRADDHWVALARFEMQVDYPDRPATRSTRQVRYTIEANEHDQLRIAAIEY